MSSVASVSSTCIGARKLATGTWVIRVLNWVCTTCSSSTPTTPSGPGVSSSSSAPASNAAINVSAIGRTSSYVGWSEKPVQLWAIGRSRKV